MSSFKLGTLEIIIDPANDIPTLSPSAVKAVIKKHVGTTVNANGKAVPAKIETPKGEVSISVAVKMFLAWQSVEHKEAVNAYKTGVLGIAEGLCNGKFHVDVTASTASGRVVIVGDYVGSLTSRTADLDAIKRLVERLNK